MTEKGAYNVVQGNATKPEGVGIKIIPHVCNNKGKWGAGFVLAVDKAFGEEPRNAYARVISLYGDQSLGHCRVVKTTTKEMIVANMIAQEDPGVFSDDGRPPIRYGALASCMQQVMQSVELLCLNFQVPVSIHCPKFGSGLAGGDWNVIEQMVKELWVDQGVNVCVYEYNG